LLEHEKLVVLKIRDELELHNAELKKQLDRLEYKSYLSFHFV